MYLFWYLWYCSCIVENRY